MAVYSIICEYNPFHNGHKYQIDSLKPDTVVCLMSSNMVQRGSFAVCDKYSRAAAALRCGADLVLELPYPYSMLSAEYFAGAGVKILNKLGFTDYLSFGCECDDIVSLRLIAEYLLSDKYESDVLAMINDSPAMPYAVAREEVIKNRLGEKNSHIIRTPNNILAVEYIKALIKTDSNIIPRSLLRKSSAHNDTSPCGTFASAGNLRDMLANKEKISGYVPNEAYAVYDELLSEGKMPSDIKRLENAILAYLRMTPAEKIKEFYDCAAVGDIIKNAASDALTLGELYEMCTTKNFTRARIRRCITAAYLGVDEVYAQSEPLYTSVLALNDKGAELLAKTRKKCDIAIITKPAHIKKYYGTQVYSQYMAGVIADDIFALTLASPERAGATLGRTPIVLKM